MITGCDVGSSQRDVRVIAPTKNGRAELGTSRRVLPHLCRQLSTGEVLKVTEAWKARRDLIFRYRKLFWFHRLAGISCESACMALAAASSLSDGNRCMTAVIIPQSISIISDQLGRIFWQMMSRVSAMSPKGFAPLP